jgi:hypothetical protein
LNRRLHVYYGTVSTTVEMHVNEFAVACLPIRQASDLSFAIAYNDRGLEFESQ